MCLKFYCIESIEYNFIWLVAHSKYVFVDFETIYSGKHRKDILEFHFF